MSEPAAYPFKYERCGADNVGTVWHSVNVTLDPELKEELLDGSLTDLVCKRCGYSKSVIYDFLYHDQDAKYMIWLRHADGDGVSRFERGALGITPKLLGRFASEYRLRVVQSRNCLVEKVFIFDAGLDDRAIEISKVTLWSQGLVQGAISPNDEIFFSHPTSDRHGGKALVYQALRAGRENLSYTEPWDEYLVSVTALRSQFGVRDGGPCKWQLIDRQYVMELAGKGKKRSRIEEL